MDPLFMLLVVAALVAYIVRDMRPDVLRVRCWGLVLEAVRGLRAAPDASNPLGGVGVHPVEGRGGEVGPGAESVDGQAAAELGLRPLAAAVQKPTVGPPVDITPLPRSARPRQNP